MKKTVFMTDKLGKNVTTSLGLNAMVVCGAADQTLRRQDARKS